MLTYNYDNSFTLRLEQQLSEFISTNTYPYAEHKYAYEVSHAITFEQDTSLFG